MGDNKEDNAEKTMSSSSGGDLLVVVREQEEEEEKEDVPWGTYEELLLACAVNRHGFNSWDSIAKNGLHFSPDDCRRKYHHLKRRFSTAQQYLEEDGLSHLIKKLREIRVQQLKRDLLQHDLSILSLEKKVKKLEEEREKKNDNSNSSSSSSLLGKAPRQINKEEPESDLRIIVGESTENRSVNESNSSKTAEVDVGPLDPPQRNTIPVGEVAGVDSSNNNDMKMKGRELQQSSEVQSSSKKKRCRFRVGGVLTDELEELEGDAHSPASETRMSVNSQPLFRFLDSLRSHKHASVFHRPLTSQETEKYRNVVRQHMDLDTVQSGLERGLYGECHPKFYRDLLLIFTNAVLFFRKSSAEHIAAREMHKLVIKEIILRTHKPKKSLPSKPDPEPHYVEPVVKKPRSSSAMVVCRRQNSMQESMKRKEESHNVPTSSSSKKNITTTNIKVGNGREEKLKGDEHQKKKVKVGGVTSSNSDAFASRKEKEAGDYEGDEVSKSKKFLTRERSNLGQGTLRLSNNNNKKIISKDGSDRDKRNGNNNNNNKEGDSVGEGDEPKEKRREVDDDDDNEKKEKPITTILKKQGVANFLKRIKQNSPSSQEKAVMSNDSDDDKDEVGRKERSDSNANKSGGNSRRSKEVVTRRSSGRKEEKEAAASSRSIGRPPKRKAAMMGGGTPDSAKATKSSGGNARKKPKR